MRDMVRLSRRLMLLLACAAVAFSAASVRAVAAASAEVRNPSGIAVIVGNKAYRHERVPEVSYAHRDAAAFRRYVVEVLGYDPENVIDLRDADQATLESVFGNNRSHEGKLWRYLDPEGGSDVVVFYSGHGVPGLKDKRGYLLPVNADPDSAEINGYPIDVLYKNLSELKEARSVRVFLDACFSGDSNQGMLVRSASPVFVKPALPKAMKKLTVMTAASEQQLASWDEKAEHGLFTHHLLDALYGKADGDKDGQVTATEAKRYLDRHMTRAARRIYGRHQKASLSGDEAVVLTAAVEGRFAARPVFKPGSVTASLAPAGAKAEPVKAAVPPASDHAASEQALGLKREERVLVQRGLKSMGLGVEYADGLFGEKTRGAIREWQEGKGFKVTGYLTGEQAEALRAVGKVADREEAQRAEKERAERQRRSVARERLAREAKAQAEAERRVREERRPGRVFRDCGECPEIVVISAGEYMMGSPDGEAGRYGYEGPRHRVKIPEAMAVGKYEVTFEEWDACMAGGGCRGYRPDDEGWGRGRHPVINVSWEDAKAYVEWLSRRTGKKYRLMSEAEWEYAARAGTEGPFHFGSTVATDQANYDGYYTFGSGYKGVYRRRTVAVGTFSANEYGLHDVHGNVWEWVEDCWHGDYGGAPMEGQAWVAGGDCSRRVLRGGSWNDDSRWILRSANRGGNFAGIRLNSLGFRVTRTLTP